MEQPQREHISAVMRLAGDALPLPPGAESPDALIRDSWLRCVHQHRLDPTRMQEAVILPQQRVREHQERLDEFLRIARHGLESLYQQVAGMGYCVLLTDARGVTVDFIGDLQLDATLRRAGLYLGSDWSEHHAGTCGVGTAIATGQALTVHQGDHFDATHIPLTCTAAPVYDPLGRLNAILDISALTSPQAKTSQHLALQLVKVYAQRVENANFLRCFRNDWVLKLHPSPEFVEISPDHLVALDAAGRIVGHNRAAQLLLQAEHGSSVLGLPFEQLFNARFDELGRFMRAMPGDRRAVTLARSGRVLFLHAVPPPSRWGSPDAAAQAVEAAVPPALAALSGGDPALDRAIHRAARLRRHARQRADHRRDRQRQGVLGQGDARRQPARAPALRRRQLRGDPRDADRERALRPPAGQLQRRAAEGQARPDPGGRRRHAVPRRDRRHAAGAAGAAAARAGRARGAADRRDTRAQGRRARDRRHARRPAPARARRRLPRRPVLPPGRRAPGAAAAARAPRPGLAGAASMLREQPRPLQLSAEAEHCLRHHDWPGNLRELRNVLDYAAAMAAGCGVIGLAELPDALLAAAKRAGAAPALPPEAQLLLQYLRAARWNVSAVAHQLGVTRMTVYRRMKRWGIREPPRG